MEIPGAKPPLRVIDLLSHGSSHLFVNRFWLQTLMTHFQITLVAEARHIAALNIPDITNVPVRRGRGWRLWRELRFLTAMVRAGRSPVLIMGATGAQLLTLAILERLFRHRATSWTVILHSEAEGVADPSDLNRKLAWLALRKLQFPRHAQAIVLGRHILSNLARLNLDSPRFHAIEHPLPDAKPIPRPARTQGLSFTVTGVIRADTKDLDMAGQLAATGQTRVRFLGRKGRDYRPVPGVSEQLTDSHYSDRWLKENLGNSDFLLLCPARHSYRFTALGSLGDALSHGLPVAWLEHDALKAAETAPFCITATNVADLKSRAKSFEPPSLKQIECWVRTRNDSAKQTFLSIMISS